MRDIGRIKDEVTRSDLSQNFPVSVKTGDIDKEKRTITLSWGSEAYVERWFGFEKLNFSSGNVRLERMKTGGQLLDNHDVNRRLGRVEDVWIEGGRGYARVRFSRSSLASEVFEDVIDGIVSNVSFRYKINDLKLENTREGADYYRVDDFDVLEISLVSIPHDYSVGIGRGREKIDTERIDKLLNFEGNISNINDNKEGIMMEVKTSEQTEVRGHAFEAGEIIKFGRQFDKLDMAAKFIEDGRSLQDFKNAILEAQASHKKVIENRPDELGLSKKEIEGFSYVRVLNAASGLDWRNAELEREISETAKALYKPDAKPSDIVIPPEILRHNFQRNFMGTGKDAAMGGGGNLIATDLLASSFIELLRSKLVIRRLGATVLSNLSSNISIPKQTSTVAGEWLPEGSTPAGGIAGIKQISLSPKRLATFTDYSRKLLIQSSLDVENFVRNDLARSIAISIDSCAISGSGKNEQPLGILNIVPGKYNLDEKKSLFENIISLETAVATKNADEGALAYLTHPVVRGLLKATPEFQNTGKPIWSTRGDGDGEMNGYRAAASTIVDGYKDSSNNIANYLIFGDFSSLIVGEFGALFLSTNPYVGSSSGTVRVDIEQHVDIGIRYDESFAVLQGLAKTPPASWDESRGRGARE